MARITLRSIDRRLDHMERMLRFIIRQEYANMAAIDDLEAEVARNTTVDESAIVLLNGLADLLEEAIRSGDPLRIQAAADMMRTRTDALAAAVLANTPAAPPPPPPPPPGP